MESTNKPKTDYFVIKEISQKKDHVVVEDEELGLVFNVYSTRKDWTRAEIFNIYSVQFFYDRDETEVVAFMT